MVSRANSLGETSLLHSEGATKAGSLTPCSAHGISLAGETNSWVRVTRRVAGSPDSRGTPLTHPSKAGEARGKLRPHADRKALSLPCPREDQKILPSSTGPEKPAADVLDPQLSLGVEPKEVSLGGHEPKPETSCVTRTTSPNSPPVTLQKPQFSPRGFLLTRTT